MKPTIEPIDFDQAAAAHGAAAIAPCARLDSGGQRSPFAGWSYLPGPPSRMLQCNSRTLVTTLRSADHEERRWTNPIEALAWLGAQLGEAASITAAPPFKGGWIGYLSYDLGRLFESIPTRAVDDLTLPLFTFTYHDQVVALDLVERRAFQCRTQPESHDALRFDAHTPRTTAADLPASNFTRRAYEQVVARAINYIAAGDIFQVNLAQRFTAGLPAAPSALYDTLRASFPAWFGAFLDYGDHALLCNSPELFLRITPRQDGSRHVLTRPIKGTRPRQPGMESALLRSPKDQAELAMIVDLERNDLGRICQIGSVKVTEPRVIEPHPTLYHGAASIEGLLRPDVSYVDILRATFPGGSVTGAPKIRAMQIIDELEPMRRGPYCGAIGYLSIDGHLEFNIAIRTMIAARGKVHFSVGAGIVADSDPAAEYEETLVKAKAMLTALRA
jgi:para-aminobenzoate synthetase component 1